MRLFIVLACFPILSSAQVNTTTWGVDDTTICIVKNTSFFNVHDYILLENFSGSPMNMIWIREDNADWPLQWEVGFTDPDSFYVDLFNEDTANFTLPYPVEFSNQLILNVDHNNHIDSSYLSFKVYPVDFPEDSLLLTFCVIIHAPDAGNTKLSTDAFQLAFDAVQQELRITGTFDPATRFILFNCAGEKVTEASILSETTSISLDYLQAGIYVAALHSPLGQQRQKIIIY